MDDERLQNFRRLAATAIKTAQHQIRWKPDKDVQHLEKRIRRGHLESVTTLDEYNRLIQSILGNIESSVYHYPFGKTDFFAIINQVDDRSWLVLVGDKGIMETAFPPDDLNDYMLQSQYVFLGKLQELLR